MPVVVGGARGGVVGEVFQLNVESLGNRKTKIVDVRKNEAGDGFEFFNEVADKWRRLDLEGLPVEGMERILAGNADFEIRVITKSLGDFEDLGVPFAKVGVDGPIKGGGCFGGNLEPEQVLPDAIRRGDSKKFSKYLERNGADYLKTKLPMDLLKGRLHSAWNTTDQNGRKVNCASAGFDLYIGIHGRFEKMDFTPVHLLFSDFSNSVYSKCNPKLRNSDKKMANLYPKLLEMVKAVVKREDVINGPFSPLAMLAITKDSSIALNEVLDLLVKEDVDVSELDVDLLMQFAMWTDTPEVVYFLMYHKRADIGQADPMKVTNGASAMQRVVEFPHLLTSMEYLIRAGGNFKGLNMQDATKRDFIEACRRSKPNKYFVDDKVSPLNVKDIIRNVFCRLKYQYGLPLSVRYDGRYVPVRKHENIGLDVVLANTKVQRKVASAIYSGKFAISEVLRYVKSDYSREHEHSPSSPVWVNTRRNGNGPNRTFIHKGQYGSVLDHAVIAALKNQQPELEAQYVELVRCLSQDMGGVVLDVKQPARKRLPSVVVNVFDRLLSRENFPDKEGLVLKLSEAICGVPEVPLAYPRFDQFNLIGDAPENLQSFYRSFWMDSSLDDIQVWGGHDPAKVPVVKSKIGDMYSKPHLSAGGESMVPFFTRDNFLKAKTDAAQKRAEDYAKVTVNGFVERCHQQSGRLLSVSFGKYCNTYSDGGDDSKFLERIYRMIAFGGWRLDVQENDKYPLEMILSSYSKRDREVILRRLNGVVISDIEKMFEFWPALKDICGKLPLEAKILLISNNWYLHQFILHNSFSGGWGGVNVFKNYFQKVPSCLLGEGLLYLKQDPEGLALGVRTLVENIQMPQKLDMGPLIFFLEGRWPDLDLAGRG